MDPAPLDTEGGTAVVTGPGPAVASVPAVDRGITSGSAHLALVGHGGLAGTEGFGTGWSGPCGGRDRVEGAQLPVVGHPLPLVPVE